MKTVVCIGTGPSLTLEQIAAARAHNFALYVCNNAIFMAPDARVLYGCNLQWWDHYHERIKDYLCSRWTTNEEAAEKYGLNWIAEKNAPGLSTDPMVIHHGHGSGFSLVNLAFLQGAERIVLLGYDLKYAQDYDGKARQIGSSPRHFFGEYPQELQHWPSVKVKNGVHVELLDLYRSVAEQGAVEIINATPGSAIDCFPMKDIEDLDGW